MREPSTKCLLHTTAGGTEDGGLTDCDVPRCCKLVSLARKAFFAVSGPPLTVLWRGKGLNSSNGVILPDFATGSSFEIGGLQAIHSHDDDKSG